MFFLLFFTEEHPWIALRDVPYFLFLGLLGFGLYQPLWSYGLKLTLASHSALILSLSPVVVTVITFLRKEEWIGKINLMGVALSFCGVLFLVRPVEGNRLSPQILWGDVLTLMAAVCWGLYSYFGKRIVLRYSPLKSGTWSMLFGVLIMFPVCFRDFLHIRRTEISGVVLFTLFYGTVLASLVAYLIWMKGIKEIGAARTSAYQYLTQVFGVFAAWLVFGEPLHWQLFLGMFLIGIGLWLAQRQSPSA